MSSTGHTNRIAACALVGAVFMGIGGCKAPWLSDWKVSHMFRLDKGMPWEDDEPTPQIPTRVVSSWTDSILNQAGKRPQRGFGGRLIFYNDLDKEPVLVDGQLVVYAFDETNRDPTDNRPTRRYVFPAEQIALHMSETKLGPSYSFWLPWDEVGGPQTEISLIPRFEPKGGAVVVGEQTKHMLSGPVRSAAELATITPSKLPEGVPMRPANAQVSYNAAASGDAAAAPAAAQQAVYQNADSAAVPGAPPAEPQRQMRTTSISLPDNFRFRGGSPASRRHDTAAAAPPNDSPPSPRAGQSTPARQAPASRSGPTRSPATLHGGYAPSPLTRPLSRQVYNAGQISTQELLGQPGGGMPSQQAYGGGQYGNTAATQITPPSPQGAGQSLRQPPGQSGGQTPGPTSSTTSVSYLSPAESARLGVHPQSSSDFPPTTPQAPGTPAFP